MLRPPVGSGAMAVRVAIIGGGAAGMVAAITAARAGAEVTVLEKGERVGRKLLATGNGRCNLTNMRLSPACFHGTDPGFAAPALAAFGTDATLSFFGDLGIAVVAEERGRAYPRSGQASSVLDVLRWEMEALGVRVACDAAVGGILRQADGFRLASGTAGTVDADRVILASGGRAAPSLGADGSGYALAKALGHAVVEPFPALAPLRLASPWLRALQGTRLDGTAEVVVAGRVAASARGEILFTDHGASGPAVMDVSRAAGEALRHGSAVELRIAAVDDLDGDALVAEIDGRCARRPDRPATALMVGFLNKRLSLPVLREAGIEDPERPAGRLSTRERARIAQVLRGWRFPVSGAGPWAHAQVTAGGVDTAGVDPCTMESRLVPGLFFAGEILDVDGDCGGFNLQWAWSSGHLAGRRAADSPG